MEWYELFGSDQQPSYEEIEKYIQNPLWEEINIWIKKNYQVEPRISYSSCSAQKGWNLKYQKSGKSLCTLYPMNGFFIALVVIGNKEQDEAEAFIPNSCAYIQELYQKTPFSAGGRWLMINITDQEILEDTKKLIAIRRTPIKT